MRLEEQISELVPVGSVVLGRAGEGLREGEEGEEDGARECAEADLGWRGGGGDFGLGRGYLIGV